MCEVVLGLFVDILGVMATNRATTEFKFLMEKENVSEDIITKLVEAGILTVKQLAVIVATTEDLRELAVSELGVDNKTLAGKAKLAALLCAFNSAKARSTEMDKADAEAMTRNIPKTVPVSDYQAMRNAFKDRFWKLDDGRAPAQGYVEVKLDHLEKGNFRAEKLSEVVAFREDNRDGLIPVWDLTGSLKPLKTRPTVPLPQTTEELRLRLQVMGAAWVFTSFQHTANAVVKDLTPELFTSYADHLLGQHVWGLAAKNASGHELASPTWNLLLNYEHEIRAHACSLLCEGDMSWDKALRMAWMDTTVKDRYFVTPLQLASSKRSAPTTTGIGGGGHAGPPLQKRTKAEKGKGKGKSKDKGKRCAFRTPGGKQVCFNFNKPDGCPKGAACAFEHVCGVCFKEGRPMTTCEHRG